MRAKLWVGAPMRRVVLVTLALLAIVLVVVALRTIPFGPHAFRPDPSAPAGPAVPLDPASPWPKFRANAVQNGRSPVRGQVDPARRPWRFATGKGVFSSPVVDAEGNAYVGSADRHFYAIDPEGGLRWKRETGEVIDSAALLDDRGHVYFGSGDAHVHALDRASGKLLWRFEADTVEEVEARYGVESYNVDWFEGNVAMLPDGTLLVPNDNFLIYALDRDDGRKRREYLGNELMWSLPAVNPVTGRIFAGSQFLALWNVFAFEADSGERVWTTGGLGSNAASPLLTSTAPEGALVLGGYDGFVRAYAQDTGKRLWSRGLRDHVYGSPAQLSDGTIVQAATDGTVYALAPETGEVVWAYDTLGPIRSSPAVDGYDRIYLGDGQGNLLALEPDGTLRWSYRCIEEERNDLNGSPALGPHGITLAGQDGGIHFVPWDYPLTEAGRRDPRATRGPGEALPPDGVFLVHTAPFGRLRLEPPRTLAANAPLAFTLFVREAGDTPKTLIDPESLEVEVTGDPAHEVEVSADGQFFVVVPRETWTGPSGGEIELRVRGRYGQDPWRLGLKFFAPEEAGAFERRFRFRVPPRPAAPFPYAIPEAPGDPATVFTLSRLAAPNPTMLPSWNQIGFDSLHYLAGIVGGTAEQAVVWVVAGRPRGGTTVPDPGQELRFPLLLDYDRGLLTFRNDAGFEIRFLGAWEMPFGSYRIAGQADPASGRPEPAAALNAVCDCNELEYYGNFLKLMGMAEIDTGRMTVFGGLDLGLLEGGPRSGPPGAGQVRFSREDDSAAAHVADGSLRAADHVVSLLLLDAASGRPLPLAYAQRTEVETDASGRVTAVRVGFEPGALPERVEALYLVDTWVMARGAL